MIIHIFNERVYFSQNLSSKISGMYPIYLDGEIVANIIADEGSWTIRLSTKFSSKEIYLDRPRLEPYKIYVINSKIDNRHFYLVATPKYSSTTKTYQMPQNQITIGSDPGCDIFYPLSFTNNEFLRIKIVDFHWIVETNAPNFFISENRAFTGQPLLCGDYIFFYGLKIIFLGTELIIDNPLNLVEIRNLKPEAKKTVLASNPASNATPASQSAITEYLPLYTEQDYFYKSPRINYIIEPASVEIDEPPEPIREEEMPAILTLGPQITMASASALSVMSLIITLTSGDIDGFSIGISIATMAITAVGTLTWPLLTRHWNKRRIRRHEQKRQKKYEKYLAQKQHLLDFIKANQKQTLLENHPSPARCVEIINQKQKQLWQRSIGQNDFLAIRLGTGKVATRLTINRPKEQFSIEDDDLLFLAMRKIVNDSLTIADAPITYNLTERNIDAIIGDKTSIKQFLDCFFLQILTFHSYTDLKIIVFTKEPNAWEYFKIAPHCWDDQKSTRYFATSVEELSTIASELEKIWNARVVGAEEAKKEDSGEKPESETTYKDFRPYYLFFIDDITAVRNVPLINKILRYKRNLGFSILTTSNNVSMLPNETSDFIYVSKRASFVMSGETNAAKDAFIADFNNSAIDMYLLTEKLANIPVPIEKGKFELPTSISFLELYNYGRVEQLNSLARWSKNNPSLSLSVPIGIDYTGEIFQMDIHEKAFGPHGLIAGTTGSGKSEWIITYVLSLAVNFSPDEVQFVLIDYKGGGLAKSFENSELGVKLPHLAGTITNLDKSEIFRSIAAIESELKRRQSIFNAAREKLKEGSMDIYKYQQYYRKGLVNEPMSHLLIICDEFAELRQQEPDFMDQLISTSRIGRSLGVHLILATQKPSGVVNDQIWSNAKFKVCLKVQDRSDSNEILRKPDAAYLKQTGSFYLQVGNDDYYNLGQVAWAGAKYYPSDTVEQKIDNSVTCIDNIGHTIDSYEEIEIVKNNQGEQLLNIVAYLTNISREITLVCRPLWLANVPDKILLANLRKKYHIAASPKYTYRTVIGEYDEPREQKQGPLSIDLAEGNIAIVGQADTSIDQLISTIIWSSITEHTPAEIAYYIIDFGAETLKKFAKFPQVGEVVFSSEVDKVAGVLNLITDEMNRRKEILSDYNGSFAYYNQVEQTKMGLVVVVINNYDVFNEALPRTEDLMNEFFRDAPKYGIIFIVSANNSNAIGYRQTQYFNHFILMQFNDDDQYRNLVNCRRGLIPKKVVGRGICKLDPKNEDSYCEFQTAMIAPTGQELSVIKAYADRCVEYYKCKVKQLTKIPADVTSADMLKYITDLTHVPIGINLYEKDVATYNFLSQKLHLIASKEIDKNLSFIYGLTSILSQIPNVKVRVIDISGIFKVPMLDIKLFNDNIDTVFAALEKDVLTRTEAQDYGINLVIGAGAYKNHLSAGGIEIFQNLFNHLATSKKSVYVFIDNYDRLRTLKLEPWFSSLTNIHQGLWLGPEFNNQSLFECNPVSTEDQKLNYKGLAFNLANGEYTTIKTLMDKDE